MKSSFHLYEISTLLHDAIESAYERGLNTETGELSPDWAKFLDDVEGERDKKALDCAKFIKSEEAIAAALKAEAQNLAKRAESHLKRAQGVKEYIRYSVQEGEKIEDSEAVISWRSSSSVDVSIPVEKLPEQYVRSTLTVEANKTEISKALKEGKEIEGCAIVKKMNLSIK